jgi:hypothetical protein
MSLIRLPCTRLGRPSFMLSFSLHSYGHTGFRVTWWVCETIAQNGDHKILSNLIQHLFFLWDKDLAYFWNLQKLPEANNRSNGENSPNLVTLTGLREMVSVSAVLLLVAVANRVTRLGEYSTFGRACFHWAVFYYRRSPNFGATFWGDKIICYFCRIRLGRLFHKLVWSPWLRITLAEQEM